MKCEIRKIPKIGRGLFAIEDIEKDELIEIAPVILVKVGSVSDENFNNYPMCWTDEYDCIALGYMNLINHAENSNCSIENDYANLTKKLFAKSKIHIGEQLTIIYACALWFEPEVI